MCTQTYALTSTHTHACTHAFRHSWHRHASTQACMHMGVCVQRLCFVKLGNKSSCRHDLYSPAVIIFRFVAFSAQSCSFLPVCLSISALREQCPTHLLPSVCPAKSKDVNHCLHSSSLPETTPAGKDHKKKKKPCQEDCKTYYDHF